MLRDLYVYANENARTCPCLSLHHTNLYSLVATVKRMRPDLLRDVVTSSDPIPNEIPEHIVEKFKQGNGACTAFSGFQLV